MEATKVLQSDLLDLIFENRNKAYGAYELRRMYDKRILKAIGITITILCLAFGSSYALKLTRPDKQEEVVNVEGKTITKLEDLPPVEVPKTTPPPPSVKQLPPPAKLQTIQFTPPVIKPDDLVQEKMPSVDDISDIKIGSVTQDGVNTDVVNLPAIGNSGDGSAGILTAPAPKEDADGIVRKVEIEAKVDGKLWRRHLEKYLQPLADNAGTEGMAPGVYTIQVRFLVEKDGSITDVQALNDPGYGLKHGVEEVVKKGPKWEPGIQNGRSVRSYHTQPLTFQIAEQ